jgi:hypothetical protein
MQHDFNTSQDPIHPEISRQIGVFGSVDRIGE